MSIIILRDFTTYLLSKSETCDEYILVSNDKNDTQSISESDLENIKKIANK